MNSFPLKSFYCLILSALLISSARADDGWDGQIVSFVWDNDATAGSDKHYTQGARLSYLSKDDALPAWLTWLSSAIPTFGFEAEARKFGVAATQEIYTPENLRASGLVKDDRPYAGWLYGTGTLQRRGATRRHHVPVMEAWKIDLGVIGPESLAEDTQKSWHGVSPSGWDNQLKTEPGANLRYERSYLFPARTGDSPWRLDVVPRVRGSAGNVLTFLGAGATFRFGYNIPNEFGVSRDNGPLRFGAYIFNGFEGRYVARNIFLDGNTFRDSHHVTKRPFVGDVRIGLALVFKRVEISAAHTFVSQEFGGQVGTDSYGTATFTVKF